jgi:hypothetical protein
VNQAYEEKLKRSEALPQINLFSELAKTQAKHQEEAEISSLGSKRNNQRASTRQKSEISLANSSVRAASMSTRRPTCRPQSNVSSMSGGSIKSNLDSATTVESNSPRPSTHSCNSDRLTPSSSTTKVGVQKNGPLPLKKSAYIKSESEPSIRPSSSLENVRAPKRRRLSTDTCSPAAR